MVIPNGDPDAGNMPRIDPTSNKGLVSDVCMKRKIRNYVESFAPEKKGDRGYEIMIHQGAVINKLVNEAKDPASKKVDPGKDRDKWQLEALSWLCNKYYDIRAFGAVISTGNEIFVKGLQSGKFEGQFNLPLASPLVQSRLWTLL